VGIIQLKHHLSRGFTLAGLRRGVVVMLLALGVAGCAYRGDDTFEAHYQRYKAHAPMDDKVFVCSSYGCRTQTPFRFTTSDIAQLKTLMAPSRSATAEDERKAVATTLAWIERRVGEATGTAADRPADDMAGNGDPTQMDCVDVATNLTSYLLVLDQHKLLRHHSVGPVVVKEDLRRGMSGWPHYAAILKEAKSGEQYAVDGWLLARGVPPEIVEMEKWYIDDGDILFGTPNAITAANTP
jgi:hypothetical protein